MNTINPPKFLFISLYFSLFLSIPLFAQQDNLEVKGKIETDSLTVRGGASFPASTVKGEVFYRNDENKYYAFDGSNWQEIGAEIDRTVASQIVGTTSSIYGSDKTCDGTSDQVEIQQAIDDLGDNKGAVYLLEGEYNVNDSIILEIGNDGIKDANKSIIGTGAGTRLKVGSSVHFEVIDIWPWIGDGKVLVSQLMIDGNKASVTGTNQGIYISSSSNSIIDTIWVKDMSNEGLGLYTSPHCIFSGNFSQSSGYYNIAVENGSSYTIVSGNIADLTTWRENFIIYQNHNSIVSGNISEAANRDGIMIGYNHEGWNSNCFHIILGNSVDGINIYCGPSYNLVLGNSVFSNHYDGISVGTCSAWSSSKNIIFSGNNMHSNQRKGISLQDIFNHIIFGNGIYENGSGSSGEHGIRIASSSYESDNNLVSSNYIYDSLHGLGNTYGICIWDTGVENTYIVGDYINNQGGYTDLIYDSGTSTRYTDKLKITLQKGEYTHTGNTISLSGPASYLRFSPTINITVDTIQKTAGTFAAGDILILENTTVNKVILNEAGNLCLHTSPLDLNQNDTLVLVYDGTNWIETGYSNN